MSDINTTVLTVQYVPYVAIHKNENSDSPEPELDHCFTLKANVSTTVKNEWGKTLLNKLMIARLNILEQVRKSDLSSELAPYEDGQVASYLGERLSQWCGLVEKICEEFSNEIGQPTSIMFFPVDYSKDLIDGLWDMEGYTQVKSGDVMVLAGAAVVDENEARRDLEGYTKPGKFRAKRRNADRGMMFNHLD